MHKKYFVFFALIVILISACAQRQQAVVSKETGQKAQPGPEEAKLVQPKQDIAPDIRELFEKSKTRISNVYYRYRGPETGSNFHEFYIKGPKIKINPYLEIKTLDKPGSYDSIFIDKAARTAASYCEAVYCASKGKKEDLNYGQAYILTIFDWAEVERAAKVGEEVIDSRSTWKIETNLGTLWVDTFYGIPLKAESNGKTYRFEQIAVNSVQDSDVVPGS
ncbi:hypothetical protein HYX06_03030 [Candidatus Woesearchaeota archaeon]|nr:hypothetical protein [Candidatus Woesearchaeota archaeon]